MNYTNLLVFYSVMFFFQLSIICWIYILPPWLIDYVSILLHLIKQNSTRTNYKRRSCNLWMLDIIYIITAISQCKWAIQTVNTPSIITVNLCTIDCNIILILLHCVNGHYWSQLCLYTCLLFLIIYHNTIKTVITQSPRLHFQSARC